MHSLISVRSAGAGLAFAALLALTACSTPAEPGAPAELAPAVDCVASALRSSLLGTGTPRPDEESLPLPGTVPEGFEPVRAVLCSGDFGEVIEVDGQPWQGVRELQYDGDFDDLLAALAVPSDSRSTGPCTADFEIVPDLWLVADSGEAIVVSWPVNGCGKTKPGVREAIDRLTPVGDRVLPVSPIPDPGPVVVCDGLDDLSGEIAVPEGEIFDELPATEVPGFEPGVAPTSPPGDQPFEC